LGTISQRKKKTKHLRGWGAGKTILEGKVKVEKEQRSTWKGEERGKDSTNEKEEEGWG